MAEIIYGVCKKNMKSPFNILDYFHEQMKKHFDTTKEEDYGTQFYFIPITSSDRLGGLAELRFEDSKYQLHIFGLKENIYKATSKLKEILNKIQLV